MRRPTLIGLILILLCYQVSVAAHADDEVNIFVPRFAGQETLAQSVSTILALQLWTSLNKKNPDGNYVRSGKVNWSDAPLPEPSIEDAVAAAKSAKSQLVLWGDVTSYGDGIIAQPILSVPQDDNPQQDPAYIWAVGNENRKLRVGLPDYSFLFSPLVLNDDVVSRYSKPDSIIICNAKVQTCQGPTLSNSQFKSAVQDGDWALVSQEGSEGWVYLPDLSAAPSEVITFSTALISYLRGDFADSHKLFAQVADSEVDSVIREQALLLGGVSLTRSGGQGVALLENALKQNPYSRYSMQVLYMAYIAELNRTDDPEVRKSLWYSAEKLLGSYDHLFTAKDEWLDDAGTLLKASAP